MKNCSDLYLIKIQNELFVTLSLTTVIPETLQSVPD